MLKQAAFIYSLAGLLLLLGRVAPVQAIEINVGDARDEVLNALGEPDGVVVFGDTEVLYFRRGQVDIQDSKVIRHTILSEEDFEALKAKREQERLLRAREAERQRAQAAAAQAEEQSRAVKDPEKEAAEARRQAEIDRKVQEGMNKPSVTTSSAKLRKYRRGRSASALEKREAQLREKYEQEIPKP